jgi:fido (protein-threonine AMPylation protein)
LSAVPSVYRHLLDGDWDPEAHKGDRDEHDALAARGYWQAFQSVKAVVAEVLTGTNPSTLVQTAHREWHREMFQPFVAVGLLPPSTLAGYRNHPVYLRGSRHVPPRAEALHDAMPVLFNLLEGEDEPSARAVLGHWMMGYLHPYPDGNGRIARFLMNAMLASGRYPWTVIRVEDRDRYLSALETASVEADMGPLARFLADRVRWSMEIVRLSRAAIIER